MKTGFVAVIGRPNVGKSTLINAFMGQKIAAVSPKAQTTRRRQMGILTTDAYQLVFIDTPGLHNPRHRLGEYLNQEAEEAIQGVDVALWLVDGSEEPDEEEHRIAAMLAQMRRRPATFIGLNKIDLVPAEELPARIAAYTELLTNTRVFPFSATRGDGRQELLDALVERMTEGEPEFEEDQITDYYERDIAVELIREACLVHLREEVPHGVNVRMDEFTERGDTGAYISATIFVERDSHKGIIIGENGNMLKKIGITARKEIENMSGRKVFLEVRCKVEKDWRDDESALRRFGYKIEKKKKKR